VDTGQNRPNDAFCKVDRMCVGGVCTDAGNWITRGEDNRTFPGGWLFSFMVDGATISPLAGEGVAFPPSAGGRTGKGLRVSITMPPLDPVGRTYPLGALGWSFGEQGTVNLTAFGSGMSFYARSTTAVSLRARLVDKWTDPRYGHCSSTQDPLIADWCHNYPEAKCELPSPQSGQDNWTLCRFAWKDFKREPYSPAGAKQVDATNVVVVHIAPAFTPAGAPTAKYDITIDDAQFVVP
jgi:hypothetical protein